MTRRRSILSEPIVILHAALKSTRTNAETGERTITISVPKSEAERVARISLYDQIVFRVEFTPSDVSGLRDPEDLPDD